MQQPHMDGWSPGIPAVWCNTRTCLSDAEASVAPRRRSIAGLTAARLPVLFGRCVLLLERCSVLGRACRRGCSSGSCWLGAVGDGLRLGSDALPPSLLFFLWGWIICPADAGIYYVSDHGDNMPDR